MKIQKGFGLLAILLLMPLIMGESGCETKPTSDQLQQNAQEQILKEGNMATGMPGITKFTERKDFKDILELRDKAIITYTYLYSDTWGCVRPYGDTIGFPIPYSTQYTNPQKIGERAQGGFAVLPQADPNGLFSPPSSEGTWSRMKDPSGKDVLPAYTEPRILATPFKLPKALECDAVMERFVDMIVTKLGAAGLAVKPEKK